MNDAPLVEVRERPEEGEDYLVGLEQPTVPSTLHETLRQRARSTRKTQSDTHHVEHRDLWNAALLKGANNVAQVACGPNVARIKSPSEAITGMTQPRFSKKRTAACELLNEVDADRVRERRQSPYYMRVGELLGEKQLAVDLRTGQGGGLIFRRGPCTSQLSLRSGPLRRQERAARGR